MNTILIDGRKEKLIEFAVIKIAIISCGILIISNIIMISIICLILPLKEIRPWLVTFNDKSEQVVTIEPFNTKINGFNYLIEIIAREYVTLRETIDNNEEKRLEKVKSYSTEQVYQAFVKLMHNQNSLLTHLKDSEITRKINILRSEKIQSQSYIFRIFWELEDVNNNSKVILNKKNFISVVSLVVQDNKILNTDVYLNPLGLKVIKYHVKSM